MGIDTLELAHGLFRVLETGDAELAAGVIHPDFSNREAAAAPKACNL